MKRGGLWVPLLGVLLFAFGGLAATLAAGNAPQLGLDLQGGAAVVLQPVTPVDDEVLDQSISIIRSRVDALGVVEPEISRQGGTIIVELPGVTDQQRALDVIGQTAELLFRPVLIGEGQMTLLPGAPEGASGIDGLDLDGLDLDGDTDGDGEEDPTPGDDADPDADDSDADGSGADDPDAEDSPDDASGADDASDSDAEDPPVEGEAAAAVLFGGDEKDSSDDPDAAGAEDTDPADSADPVDDPDVAEPGTSGDGADPATPDDTEGIIDPASWDPFALDTMDERGVTKRELLRDDLPVIVPYLDEGADGATIEGRLLVGPAEASGEIVSDANARFSNEWTVSVDFTRAGSREFDRMAALCNPGNPNVCPAGAGGAGRLGIVLDGVAISAPTIQTANFNGSASISGNFSEQSARDLALVLRFGALPIELEPQTVQTVSASLGRDSLDAGIVAGLVGLLLVGLYVIAYYRLLGVVMLASLTVSATLLWTIISYLGASAGLALTLAGATGLIVSIGVAADSNIVYYERIKEEVRLGRSLRSAVDRSFQSAFSTILKADLVSLIGAAVLYFLTIGPVRGFALFLGLATLLDIVTSWFFMRPAVILLGRSERFGKPSYFGVAIVDPSPAKLAPTGASGGAK